MPREIRRATRDLHRACPRCGKQILQGELYVQASNSKNGHKPYHVQHYQDAWGNPIFDVWLLSEEAKKL